MIDDKIKAVLAGTKLVKVGDDITIGNVDELAVSLRALLNPSGELKFCPVCLMKGTESIVHVSEKRPTTNFHTEEWYDEKGRLHTHGNNSYRMYFACTNGHQWNEQKRAFCWCGHE